MARSTNWTSPALPSRRVIVSSSFAAESVAADWRATPKMATALDVAARAGAGTSTSFFGAAGVAGATGAGAAALGATGTSESGAGSSGGVKVSSGSAAGTFLVAAGRFFFAADFRLVAASAAGALSMQASATVRARRVVFTIRRMLADQRGGRPMPPRDG
ncbi:hypothetical protein COEX109129_29700 [Corallococcus exiguus]